jgi:hypothetical protein
VFAVDSFGVRNSGPGNEEFGNFATHREFPRLIAPDEIWIGNRLLEPEGIYYIAAALTRLKALADGTPDDKAYTLSLDVERGLRERLTGVRFRAGRADKQVPPDLYVEPYLTLPDPKFPVEVWLVDGNLVRSRYKTDYTEGGHGYVYRWVPRNQIWIENDLELRERPFVVSHEYLELRLMRDRKLEYDQAHEICSKVEYKLRCNEGCDPLLAPGPRKLSKTDLPKLTKDDFLNYVVRHYLKG